MNIRSIIETCPYCLRSKKYLKLAQSRGSFSSMAGSNADLIGIYNCTVYPIAANTIKAKMKFHPREWGFNCQKMKLKIKAMTRETKNGTRVNITRDKTIPPAQKRRSFNLDLSVKITNKKTAGIII